MKKLLLLAFIVLINTTLFSQVTGSVTSTQGEPLTFVNIYIENTYTGTTSNDNGIYELNISEKGTYTIVFKFIGYKTLKKTVSINSFPFTLDATLENEDISLTEVVINSDENPANKIIRNAIAHRKKNLENTKTYTSDFYSRGFIKIENVPEKILGQEIGDLDGNLDSTRSGMIYLSETISKLTYQYPDKLKEHIIASKVSGNDNGFSFNSASSVDFNIYNPTVEIGNQIVSPIASNAFNYYRYKLEGVFYDDQGHLINQITVIPRRENDRVFSGTIYIVEDQWALYGLELSVTGEQAQIPAAKTITIKQTFSYSDIDKLWALISNNIDFSYGMFGITGNGRFTAVYSNYNFHPDFTKKTFTSEILSFEKEANKKDSLFWNNKRPVPLTAEEATDYVKKDSIQTIRKSETYLDSIDAERNKFKLTSVLFGYNYQNSYKNWNIGYSNPLENLSFNTVQGFNSDINLYFNKSYDDYTKRFSANAKINYGFSDERLRASGAISYKFNNTNRRFAKLSGGVSVEQFNGSNPISKLINTAYSLLAEENYMKLYEKQFIRADYSQELFNGLYLGSAIAYEARKPLFNTTDQAWFPQADKVYSSNNPLDETAYTNAPFVSHNIMKLGINAFINFGQKYMSYPDGKFNVSSDKYPSLLIGYEKGFGATISNYNFDEIKARIYQGFDVGNKGYFQYNLKGGTFINADNIAFIDYKHFNGNQTQIGSGSSYINVFNNLPYYSMSTNKSYAELHVEHDFKGFILGKIPLLNKLNFNLVAGAHALSVDGKNPYQEFSIGLDNLGWGNFRFLRLDYVRSYQSGFQSDAIIFGIKLLN